MRSTIVLAVGLCLMGCARGVAGGAATRDAAVVTSPSASAPSFERIGRPPPIEAPLPLCPPPSRARSHPRGEIYAGASVLVGPGLGGAVHGGQVFARTPLATWSFELEVGAEDLDIGVWGDAEGGSTWGQVQGGVKASFRPCARSHPTARAGVTWFRTTGSTDVVEDAGDYVGLYGGVGWEWDLGGGWTTGPEVSALLVSQEGEFEPVVVPQVQWHVILRF